ILSGVVVTIELAVLVVVTGILAGLALALLRSLAIRPLNWLIVGVVDVFRSLPPLVVIVLIYFGLPSIDVSPSGFVSTWLALGLVLMAFSEEIFWAGITSVAKGQWEASRSTGLSFGQTLLSVVLPQALRLTVAPLTNHHRHHQGDRARHRRGAARDPGYGELGGVEFLQSLATDDGGRRLSRAFPAGRGAGALDRDP